jgi:outer membrane protein assembly factor BamD
MIFKRCLLILVVSLVGCSSVTPEKFTSDKPLYDYASRLFDKKDFTESITFFESLRNRFPQSPYLLDTELKIAQAKFEKEDFAESEVEFQNFRILHPTNVKIPYIVYMLGMTHYKRVPGGIDRDQTHVEKAITFFEELMRRWPASTEAAKAQPLVSECKRSLLERELYVANFYLKRDEYGAALQRLETVRSNPDFKDLSAEAAYKLGYAHYKLKNAAQAKEILERIVSDPDAKEYREKAKTLLKEVDSL